MATTLASAAAAVTQQHCATPQAQGEEAMSRKTAPPQSSSPSPISSSSTMTATTTVRVPSSRRQRSGMGSLDGGSAGVGTAGATTPHHPQPPPPPPSSASSRGSNSGAVGNNSSAATPAAADCLPADLRRALLEVARTGRCSALPWTLPLPPPRFSGPAGAKAGAATALTGGTGSSSGSPLASAAAKVPPPCLRRPPPPPGGAIVVPVRATSSSPSASASATGSSSIYMRAGRRRRRPPSSSSSQQRKNKRRSSPGSRNGLNGAGRRRFGGGGSSDAAASPSPKRKRPLGGSVATSSSPGGPRALPPSSGGSLSVPSAATPTAAAGGGIGSSMRISNGGATSSAATPTFAAVALTRAASGSECETSATHDYYDDEPYECDSEGTSATTNSEVSSTGRGSARRVAFHRGRRGGGGSARDGSGGGSSLAGGLQRKRRRPPDDEEEDEDDDDDVYPRCRTLREALRVALALVLDHAFRTRGGYVLSPAERRRAERAARAASAKASSTSTSPSEAMKIFPPGGTNNARRGTNAYGLLLQQPQQQHPPDGGGSNPEPVASLAHGASAGGKRPPPPGPTSSIAESVYLERRARLLAMLGYRASADERAVAHQAPPTPLPTSSKTPLQPRSESGAATAALKATKGMDGERGCDGLGGASVPSTAMAAATPPSMTTARTTTTDRGILRRAVSSFGPSSPRSAAAEARKSGGDNGSSNNFVDVDGGDGPPFTVQRIAEVLVMPERYYTQTHKLCNGLEKLLLVTSPSSAFGGTFGGQTSQSLREDRERAALKDERGRQEIEHRQRRLRRRMSSSSSDGGDPVLQMNVSVEAADGKVGTNAGNDVSPGDALVGLASSITDGGPAAPSLSSGAVDQDDTDTNEAQVDEDRRSLSRGDVTSGSSTQMSLGGNNGVLLNAMKTDGVPLSAAGGLGNFVARDDLEVSARVSLREKFASSSTRDTSGRGEYAPSPLVGSVQEDHHRPLVCSDRDTTSSPPPNAISAGGISASPSPDMMLARVTRASADNIASSNDDNNSHMRRNAQQMTSSEYDHVGRPSIDDPQCHAAIARAPMLFSAANTERSGLSPMTTEHADAARALQVNHSAALHGPATLDSSHTVQMEIVIDSNTNSTSSHSVPTAAVVASSYNASDVADLEGRSSASNSDVDSESGDDISLDDSASDRSDGSDSGSGAGHFEPFTAARVMALNRMQQQQQQRREQLLQSRALAAVAAVGSYDRYRPPPDSEYQSGDSIDSMMAEDSGGSDSSLSDVAD